MERATISVDGSPGLRPGIHSQVHVPVVVLYVGRFSEMQYVSEQLDMIGVGFGPNPGIHSQVHFPVFGSSTGCFSDMHIIVEHAGGVITFVGAGTGTGEVVECFTSALA